MHHRTIVTRVLQPFFPLMNNKNIAPCSQIKHTIIKNDPYFFKHESLYLARPTGFEPAISSVTGRRDRPLHYGRMLKVLNSVPNYILMCYRSTRPDIGYFVASSLRCSSGVMRQNYGFSHRLPNKWFTFAQAALFP